MAKDDKEKDKEKEKIIVTREMIIEDALTWLDVKFKHQGRTKRFGADCLGLVIAIGRKRKLDKIAKFKRYKSYKRVPDGDLMTRMLRKYMTPIPVEDALPGDIYHMAFLSNPQHLAILMPDNNIIHSNSDFGKVVMHRLDNEWRYRIHGAYSYKGIS